MSLLVSSLDIDPDIIKLGRRTCKFSFSAKVYSLSDNPVNFVIQIMDNFDLVFEETGSKRLSFSRNLTTTEQAYSYQAVLIYGQSANGDAARIDLIGTDSTGAIDRTTHGIILL